jgi:hypothetical protein
MKTAARVVLSFVAFWLAATIVSVLSSFLPFDRGSSLVEVVVALPLAVLAAIAVWRRTESIRLHPVLMGGIVVGTVCFLAGFIGPMIFFPSSNQGPLLGIFITGPAGFLLGLAGGWWHQRPGR